MTETLAVEKVVPDIDTLGDLDFDMEVACEVPARAEAVGHGTPQCLGDPAIWVAWRGNCCPQSPRYMLICDHCKQVYNNWLAKFAMITCGDCHAETGGFITNTPLNRQS